MIEFIDFIMQIFAKEPQEIEVSDTTNTVTDMSPIENSEEISQAHDEGDAPWEDNASEDEANHDNNILSNDPKGSPAS